MSDTNAPTAEQLALAEPLQRLSFLESQIPTNAAAAAQTQVALRKSQVNEPNITAPPAFNGDREAASEFLIKIDHVFKLQPFSFADDEAKIAYVANLLNDEAFKWYEPHGRLAAQDQPDWLRSWYLFRAAFELLACGELNLNIRGISRWLELAAEFT